MKLQHELRDHFLFWSHRRNFHRSGKKMKKSRHTHTTRNNKQTQLKDKYIISEYQTGDIFAHVSCLSGGSVARVGRSKQRR